jgi:large subunit ribosomal protein L18
MRSKDLRSKIRKIRTRSKFAKEGYRLSIHRSDRFIYAQVIDQKTGKIILGGGEGKFLEKEELNNTKTEKAKIFGVKFAKLILENKIKEVIFDRGCLLYHGRVKAFAEGAREGGLKF